ncbi:MAG: hypothetical protein A3F72_14645 [Bacteroidetes bacterium RIFCSPLOWO2_12_FULL_35_15]|nr:MAG: hypothetical protein A3F72_14645 [Bacteroidetes bacterium RIFCSPLOWO2_12_FULL_35_15]
MQIEKEHTRTFYLPLTEWELQALISSVRLVVYNVKGELSTEAVVHLKQVLKKYEIVENKLKENLS